MADAVSQCTRLGNEEAAVIEDDDHGPFNPLRGMRKVVTFTLKVVSTTCD